MNDQERLKDDMAEEAVPQASALEFEWVACPLCNGGEAAPLPYIYSYRGATYRLVRCRRCGLVYCNPRPTQRGLASLYSQTYFEGDYALGTAASHSDYFDSKAKLLQKNRRLVREFEEQIGWTKADPKGRLLEVGCAGGFFLAAAREAGWEVAGVEISDYAASFARREMGLPVITGTIEEANLPPEHFDLIYMDDVLEHLPEPLVTLAALHRMLRPGGWLVIDMPLRNSLHYKVDELYLRLSGKSRRIDKPPYHLSEFTTQTVNELLQKEGFRVVHHRARALAPGEILIPPPASRLEATIFRMLRLVNYPLTSTLGLAADQTTVYARKLSTSLASPTNPASSTLAQQLVGKARALGLTANHGANLFGRVLAKVSRPDPKIMILGSYGVGNAGDEAILTGILRWIQDTKPEARICVPSRRRPDLMQRLHGVDSAPLFSPRTLWRFLTSEVLVVGGGSLFDHEMQTVAKLLPLFPILAKLLGKKVILTSLGFYRGYPWLPTTLARVAYALADGASVRDLASWEQTGWARRRRTVEIVSDPSIGVEAAPPEESQNLLKAEGIDPNAFLIGLQLRYLRNEAVNRRVVAEVAKAADELAGRLGAQVVFFPMDRSMTVVGSSHGDQVLADELKAAMQNRQSFHTLYREDYTPAQIKGLMGQMRLFIGMRLIPLYFSYSLGVPTVAIPYSDKVSSLLEMLGEEGMSPWELEAGKLVQMAEAALRRRQTSTEDA